MLKKHAEKIESEELKEKIMTAGRSWHHHCLSPQCYVNDTGKDIIMLEKGFDIFYCESTPELKAELEEHAYQLAKPKRKSRKKISHEALDMIRQYVKDGTTWHFHLAMPHCFLCMQDKYLLILENDDTQEKLEWIFDRRPVLLVRAIDDYYLGRKR